jgi:hypothetical protein
MENEYIVHKSSIHAIFTFFLVMTCTGCFTVLNAAVPVLQNDIFWKDMSGKPIYSQGGGVIKVGDIWYWYGAKYKGAETYYANPGKKNSEVTFESVTCYSSKDLVNWKFEKDIFSGQTGWFGRLGVAYNAKTKKYVLVAQGGGGILFATCDTPNGQFTLDNIQTSPPGIANGGTGDQTIFTDDDGKAYLICSSQNGRSNLYVAPLRESDFLKVEQSTRIFGGAGREGNCMFKYRSRYYFCSSDLHGWNSSQCYYISAEKILGPYSSEAIMINSDLDFCHVTQTGFFITVNGTRDTTVLFCGDRWSDFAGNGIGYNQWCPLTFDGIKPVFNSLTHYHFDAVTGTWNVAAENNYVLNGSFEADRVTQSKLAGWVNSSSISGGTDPNSNASGAHSGNFCIQQKYTTAFKAAMYQEIKRIPNGTYTLTAWVQSSGGQNSCKVFAADFGGSESIYDIDKTISSWTKINVMGIAVTNGSCKVGIISDAKANNWCKVDDISLVKTDPVGADRCVIGNKSIPSDHTIQMVVNHNFQISDDESWTIFTLGGRRLGVLYSHGKNQKYEGLAPGVYPGRRLQIP